MRNSRCSKVSHCYGCLNSSVPPTSQQPIKMVKTDTSIWQHTCPRTHQDFNYQKGGKKVYRSLSLTYFNTVRKVKDERVEDLGAKEPLLSQSLVHLCIRGFQRVGEFRLEQWPFILNRVNGPQSLVSVGSNQCVKSKVSHPHTSQTLHVGQNCSYDPGYLHAKEAASYIPNHSQNCSWFSSS